jgi:NAD(P)-dependent dehydrogenase (short-subunit alcohol dehydrogenase family)
MSVWFVTGSSRGFGAKIVQEALNGGHQFFLAERRGAIRILWQRALDLGEVTSEIDVETATDILFGP